MKKDRMPGEVTIARRWCEALCAINKKCKNVA